MANSYDDIRISIDDLHHDSDKKIIKAKKKHVNPFFGAVSFLAVKILIKIGIYQRLVDSGIIRGWFNVFVRYWQKKLGARPISIHDFHFLRSSYRIKFQSIEVKEDSEKKDFSYAWQRCENIYSTFSAVYRYALDPSVGYGYAKYLKKKDKLLEYGCGIAPITSSLVYYFSYKDLDFSIADIKGFPFHYAKYYLKNQGVKFYNIEPYRDVRLKDRFDAIFLITVMEHLPDPDKVIKFLTDALNKGGKLFFDYVVSEGKGLDTRESLLKRKSVLEYIDKHYTIIKGDIDFDNDIGLAVAVKM